LQQIRPVGLQQPLGQGSPHVDVDEPPVPDDPPEPDDPPPTRWSVMLHVPSQTILMELPATDPEQVEVLTDIEMLLPLTVPVAGLPVTESLDVKLQPLWLTVVVLPV
jgi:hypothetical protein